MNRREFLNLTAATAGVVAALRAGDLYAAEASAAAMEDATGLKHSIYNVHEYGVQGDGVTDELPAIEALYQRVNRDHPGSGNGAAVTYFFPAGRYLFTDMLRYTYNKAWGQPFNANYICQFIGQGPMLSQLVLKPGAEGYQDPEHPKVFFGPGGPGETLGMLADGLAFLASENGTNPGAIALHWGQHLGVSRNLVAMGGHTCFKNDYAGFEVVENLTCLGGRYGVFGGGGRIWQSLSCLGFTETGVAIGRMPSAVIYNLYTRGQGPGLRAAYNHVAVVGARLEADPPGQEAAVVNHNGGVTCVMLETSGYRQMVKDGVPAAAESTSVLSFYSSPKLILPPAVGKER